jgi:tyrosyl-tRNA synthetase
MISLDTQLSIIRRGTVEIVPEPELVAKIERSIKTGTPLRVKLGCDPTRPDLHLGHSVILRKLRQFQDLGHHAILIIGDFTGMIGDPTGANKTRPSLTIEQVRKNGESYFQQASKILDSDPAKLTIVHNSTWLGPMGFEDLIRLASKFTVARMIERDDFTKRYQNNEPISLHEFLYPLAQGQDSVHLKSDVELGGSDQKFNLLVGRDLQRSDGQEPQVALMMPLLVGTDGVNKMSKSYDNYVGLDEAPNDMYGKILKVNDDQIYSWFELLTDVSNEDLAQLKLRAVNDPRNTKHDLALTLTRMYHGADAAHAARAHFEKTIVNKEIPDEMPEFELRVDADLRILAVMVAAGVAPSISEARRLVQQGAVSIDGAKVADPALVLESAGDPLVLKSGKRTFVKLIRVSTL